MKAIVMFNRDILEWHLVELKLNGSFVHSLRSIKQRLTDKGSRLYPLVLEVEVLAFKVTGKKTYEWSSDELPKTPTIREAIAETRSIIESCLSKLNYI